jgi:hypothetical protein
VLERPGGVEVSPPNDSARLARSAAYDDSDSLPCERIVVGLVTCCLSDVVHVRLALLITFGGRSRPWVFIVIIIIISNLSNDRSKASSKTIPPHSAI